MKRLRRLPVTLAMAICVGLLPSRAPAAALDKAAIDKLVASIADYDTGKSRKPLFAVEQLIRDTQGQAELRQHLQLQLAKLLETGASEECKLFVCQQLWIIGTDISLPALQKLLADEKTAHMACYALGKHPGPGATKALREALAVARGKALVSAIGLLGERRDDASVAEIGKLASDGDPAVAEAAVSALGKISGEEAAKVLRELRSRAQAPMRAVVTAACLQCAEGLAAKGKTQQAIAMYSELMAASEPKAIRKAALIGLANTGGAQAVAVITAVLRGNDAVMKATAIAHIRTLRGGGLTERFAAELPSLPPREQAQLIGALASRGAAARPAITGAVRSADPEVRTAAVKALGQIGDASSVEPLVQAAVQAKSAEEQRGALVSLRLLSGDGVDAAIIKSMKGSPPELRPELIAVLSDRDAASAVPVLFEQAANGDARSRAAAFKALGKLSGCQGLPELVKLLVGLQGDEVREEAERACVLLSRKVRDEAIRADMVLSALNTVPDEPAKCSLLRVLGGIANAKAFDAVQAALKDTNPRVQDAAVRTMANWPDGRAIGPLLGVLKATQDDTHRVVALRGCVRLLALPGVRLPLAASEVYAGLMSHAQRPEDKKLVLAGLAEQACPEALDAAMACVSDDAVKPEAALAVMKLARAISGAYRDEAKAAAEKLRNATADPEIRKQASELVELIGQYQDFLTAWQVSGPFAVEGSDYRQLFDTPFGPEQPDAKDVAWRLMPAGTDKARPWILDLLKLLGGEQRVAYARTWIYSPDQQPTRLELGSDDGIKVWLNGQVVHANNTGRAAVPGTDKVDVTLRKGWNRLLLKVTQCNSPWEFCARLCKPDGGRLEGLKARAEEQKQ